MRMSYMTRWADGVDCMCFLSFVFLCVARRLELSPCNTYMAHLHLTTPGLCRFLCVTQRVLQTPGTAEEPKRQETPTKNPNDRRSAQLTYKAPGTIERAAHPGGGQERGLRTGGR